MSSVDLYAPIAPIASVDGWKTLPIRECGEPLVALGPFSPHTRFFSDAIYFGEGNSSPYKRGELQGTMITPFVRQGVAQGLERAAAHLPPEHAFLIWDSYRPLSVQAALYTDYKSKLMNVQKLSDAAATVEAQKMVSIPSSDPTKPSPHNTGAAVDLTIVRFTPKAWNEIQKLDEQMKSPNWQDVYKAEMRRLEILHSKDCKPLQMGTAFDEVAPQTATRFFEERQERATLTRHEAEVLNNRRLLVNAMAAGGFSNYAEEWWHFDRGNQFCAARTGQPAIYGAAVFSEANQAHETMRQGHYSGNLFLQQLPAISAASRFDAPLVSALDQFVQSEARRAQPLDTTTHPKAHRLEVR